MLYTTKTFEIILTLQILQNFQEFSSNKPDRMYLRRVSESFGIGNEGVSSSNWNVFSVALIIILGNIIPSCDISNCCGLLAILTQQTHKHGHQQGSAGGANAPPLDFGSLSGYVALLSYFNAGFAAAVSILPMTIDDVLWPVVQPGFFL